MKNHFYYIRLIFILSFIPFIVRGQRTKHIVKYFPHSKQIMEEYDVLKKNPDIKDGKYTQYYRANPNSYNSDLKQLFIRTSGYYFQNQMDGIWLYYNRNNLLLKKEIYNAGKKTGIWETYLEKGQVVKRYDYDNQKELMPNIFFSIKYPELPKENGIEGAVKVYVKFNPDCSIDTIFVSQPADPYLDKAAVEGVKDVEKIKKEYLPNQDCSTKKDTTYTINFSLY